jgi:hypothetical protein
MTPQHDLVALALRVESGSGSDRELDSAILDFLNDPSAEPTWPFVEGSYAASITPPLTASIDAVVALIEEKLPDAAWLVARQGKPDGFFVHAGVGQAQCNSITAPGVTPARALLAAALRAMKEEGR